MADRPNGNRVLIDKCVNSRSEKNSSHTHIHTHTHTHIPVASDQLKLVPCPQIHFCHHVADVRSVRTSSLGCRWKSKHVCEETVKDTITAFSGIRDYCWASPYQDRLPSWSRLLCARRMEQRSTKAVPEVNTNPSSSHYLSPASEIVILVVLILAKTRHNHVQTNAEPDVGNTNS